MVELLSCFTALGSMLLPTLKCTNSQSICTSLSMHAIRVGNRFLKTPHFWHNILARKLLSRGLQGIYQSFLSSLQQVFIRSFILVRKSDKQLCLNNCCCLPRAGPTSYGLYQCTPCHALSHAITEAQVKGTHQHPIMIHLDSESDDFLNESDWTPADKEVTAQYPAKELMTTETSVVVLLGFFLL